MGWWVGAILLGIFQFAGIVSVMVGVFRQKEKAWSKNSIFGYCLHGVTAVLALWMLLKAVAGFGGKVGNPMKKFLNILGGIFLLLGIVGIVFVVVAVATQAAGYTTFTGLIPALVIHAVCLFIGMVLIGLARRRAQPVA